MNFDNTYLHLPERFYAKAIPANFSNPHLLQFNEELALQLGLNLNAESPETLASIFSGQKLLEGSAPVALAYAAHQFGHFVPQLGDGRAMLLGEVIDINGKRFDIQLKGCGPTAFSRNGDGMSAIGPVIREYIVSEAMHHLGIPTTRALAAVATGDNVFRQGPLPGGVFTRVASSHIRIGTFQFFASRGDIEGLKALLDYSIDRHYPHIRMQNDQDPAILFLREVIKSQVSLVSKWMGVGFIHGVMNTDNMSISGETIDYGPCAFMDQFNPNQVYSYIDRNGRYCYMNQGPIVQWNLSRLAECLIPLVDADENSAVEKLNDELSTIKNLFAASWAQEMGAKLGLDPNKNQKEDDQKLVEIWLNYLEKEQLDFTLSFRQLANTLDGQKSEEYFPATTEYKLFQTLWTQRLSTHHLDYSDIKEKMNRINPLYIPRNHQVERAIEKAVEGDLSVFNEMNLLLKGPYQYQADLNFYRLPPKPEEIVQNTFCGT